MSTAVGRVGLSLEVIQLQDRLRKQGALLKTLELQTIMLSTGAGGGVGEGVLQSAAGGMASYGGELGGGTKEKMGQKRHKKRKSKPGEFASEVTDSQLPLHATVEAGGRMLGAVNEQEQGAFQSGSDKQDSTRATTGTGGRDRVGYKSAKSMLMDQQQRLWAAAKHIIVDDSVPGLGGEVVERAASAGATADEPLRVQTRARAAGGGEGRGRKRGEEEEDDKATATILAHPSIDTLPDAINAVAVLGGKQKGRWFAQDLASAPGVGNLGNSGTWSVRGEDAAIQKIKPGSVGGNDGGVGAGVKREYTAGDFPVAVV